ncbi:hypothetical protein FB451DRAFT_432769 [Mycena latifolia]|nr:hypothetical protein FB451DRAFT_432769 [Mycena latifolia]
MFDERAAAKRFIDAGGSLKGLQLDNLDEPLIYDLFGVDEHMGGLGGDTQFLRLEQHGRRCFGRRRRVLPFTRASIAQPSAHHELPEWPHFRRAGVCRGRGRQLCYRLWAVSKLLANMRIDNRQRTQMGLAKSPRISYISIFAITKVKACITVGVAKRAAVGEEASKRVWTIAII